MLLHDYFIQWINTYKKGVVTQVTLDKYLLSYRWIMKLAPSLKLKEVNRQTYQNLISAFAETHAQVTVNDFHTQVKASLLDAMDDEMITKLPPFRKIVLKGSSTNRNAKPKYLNKQELQALLTILKTDLDTDLNRDHFILLLAKTGLRFSEALALTPKDFDLKKRLLRINKTLNYKYGMEFAPTKNPSSVRTIPLDWQLIMIFSQFLHKLPEDEPIFQFMWINSRARNAKGERTIFNSTLNDYLMRLCRKADIPTISIHGLRHTHASLLLSSDVSLISISKRLGHANTVVTQKVYLHQIRELENKDNQTIISELSGLV